mmetsp:Transcript_69573/g.201620  ORF Transcript_69573/g.201620 Transcript_69573/m.201620 type:complete len:277 (-) Transcript_69573:51-881(-)
MEIPKDVVLSTLLLLPDALPARQLVRVAVRQKHRCWPRFPDSRPEGVPIGLHPLGVDDLALEVAKARHDDFGAHRAHRYPEQCLTKVIVHRNLRRVAGVRRLTVAQEDLQAVVLLLLFGLRERPRIVPADRPAHEVLQSLQMGPIRAHFAAPQRFAGGTFGGRRGECFEDQQQLRRARRLRNGGLLLRRPHVRIHLAQAGRRLAGRATSAVLRRRRRERVRNLPTAPTNASPAANDDRPARRRCRWPSGGDRRGALRSKSRPPLHNWLCPARRSRR